MAAKPPAYKDITLGQLRSFCETARRGSLTAAASALRLAHPTVWKQVHALEKAFGRPLIEPHARGCRLTEAGEVLLRLAAPNVFDLDGIRTRLDEELRMVDVRITVIAPRDCWPTTSPLVFRLTSRDYPQARVALVDCAEFRGR